MKQYELPEIVVEMFEVEDVLSISESIEPSTGGEDFTTPGDEFADE